MGFDLKKEMRVYGTQSEIARKLEISRARVSAMKVSNKPSDALLRLLGWERVITETFKRVKNGN